MSPCGRPKKQMIRELEGGRASSSCFFNETFSTNTLVEAEVDDVMVNHLNPGESRHDTTTGVSWKSGVGSFLFFYFFLSRSYHHVGYLIFFCYRIPPYPLGCARVEALSERIKGFPCGVCWRFPWDTALDVRRAFNSASTSLSRTVDNGLPARVWAGAAEGQAMRRVSPGAGTKRGRLFARSHKTGQG